MSTDNPQAKAGDTVHVHYTGTLDDGSKFDSSEGRDPLSFQIGAGQVIPGFDEAVTGMAIGDSKTVTIPSEQAYGPRNPEMTQEIPRAAIPAEIELSKGVVLSAQGPDGQRLNFQVMDFNDETVSVDGNHPLAGENLTFALELTAIN